MKWLIHALGGVTDAEAKEQASVASREAEERTRAAEHAKLAKSIEMFEAAREAALLAPAPEPPVQVDPSWVRVWSTWRGDPNDCTIRFFTSRLGGAGAGFPTLSLAETNLTNYEDFTLNRVRAIGVELLPSDDAQVDAAVRAILPRCSTLRLERGATNLDNIAPMSAFDLGHGPTPVLWAAPPDPRGGWAVQLVVANNAARQYLPRVAIRVTVWVEPEADVVPELRKSWFAAAEALARSDKDAAYRGMTEVGALLSRL